MSILYKEYVQSIKPYVPGKPIDEVKRELGLDEVVKLASNENPLGLSEKVKDALSQNFDEFSRYPDGGTWCLREKLARYLNIENDEIVIGNGSNELIEFIARGFINEGDTVISSEYAFLVYPLLTKVCNGKYIEVPMKDFRYDLEAIARVVDEKTRVIFLANPNNPTGTYFTKSEFESFLDVIPSDVIVCLDEAYVDFVDKSDYPNGLDYFRRGNVIVLRTFSKAFGLAGFRIGYAVAHKDVITYFNKIRQPFNVNAPAQIAACAALDDKDYISRTIEVTNSGKKYLCDEFDRLGLTYLKSQTNFILVKVNMDSKKFFNECLKRGVVLRDMKAYKLDDYVRVTVGTMDENKKAITVIEKVLSA